MKKYNDKSKTDVPIIFNTYQCYLKSTPGRVARDLQLSHRNNFHFAAKLVRGAYMTAEHARADDNGVESPIHNTIQDTHDCYNPTVKFLFDARRMATSSTTTTMVGDNNSKEDNNTSENASAAEACEVMLGTHNQESIEKAIAYIETHCEGNGNHVGSHFAQCKPLLYFIISVSILQRMTNHHLFTYALIFFPLILLLYSRVQNNICIMK